MGYRLLKKVDVKAKIDELIGASIGDEENLRQSLVDNLKAVANSDPADFFDENGNFDKNLGDSRAISGISVQTIQGRDGRIETNMKIKLHSKNQAAKQLMDYYQMIKEIGDKERPLYIDLDVGSP